MEEEIIVLNNELDNITMTMLRLMKDYINNQIVIEKMVKEGSLLLAKSRFIMGNRNVSALQLPTEGSKEFSATTKVFSGEDDSKNNFIFELSRLSIHDQTLEKNIRNVNKKVDVDVEDKNENSTDDKLHDPLKWFGVLIPLSLRQAQTRFSKSLDYVIELANLKSEIARLKISYISKLKKRDMLIKVSET